MGAIPKTFVGKFVWVGDNKKLVDASRTQLNDTLILGIDALKHEMMFPYQHPKRNPAPKIPMAKDDYTVTISPLTRVKHRARAAKARKKAKERKMKGVPKSKKKRKWGGIQILSKARTQYFLKKQSWVKGRGAAIYDRLSKKRKKKLAERRKAGREHFKKMRDSKLGKVMGFGRRRKRGRKPKIRLGILDRVAPIRRPRRSKAPKQADKEIIVKPGRLRRYSGRGLSHEGSLFKGGISVFWGVPQMGGGRFYNYASDVERNPNAGAKEGSGKSPYVKRTMQFVAEECRVMSMGMNERFREAVGKQPAGVYGVKLVTTFKSQY